MTIQFRNSKPTYFNLMQDPASGKLERVRLIHWFNDDRDHARVEFTKTGRKVSVPANLLFPA